jgi:hypothetical protein
MFLIKKASLERAAHPKGNIEEFAMVPSKRDQLEL